MDKQRIEAAVREILIAIGEDPDREGLVETPSRVARMYEEIFGDLRTTRLATSSSLTRAARRWWSCEISRSIQCASII